MPAGTIVGDDQRSREESRVCAALVREIGNARTWADIVVAADALIHTRIMAKHLRQEASAQTVQAVRATGVGAAAQQAWGDRA